MTTMTEREFQKRLVDLSVFTLSALILGGGYLLAARVDHDRAARTPPLEDAAVAPSATRVAVAAPAPIAGLVPAPTPRRRVVVVRRTRAS
jgi:hypothetical protein